MLVLTRKVGSSIVIGGHIKVQVVQIKGRQVRLGISAPKETKVNREEVQERALENRRENQENRKIKPPSPDCLQL